MDIKYCPFCGCSETNMDEVSVAVVCTNCNAYGPGSENEEEAVEDWNRRAELELSEAENNDLSEDNRRLRTQVGELEREKHLIAANARGISMAHGVVCELFGRLKSGHEACLENMRVQDEKIQSLQAERDRLREALLEIASHGTERDANGDWIHWRDIASKALEGIGA